MFVRLLVTSCFLDFPSCNVVPWHLPLIYCWGRWLGIKCAFSIWILTCMLLILIGRDSWWRKSRIQINERRDFWWNIVLSSGMRVALLIWTVTCWFGRLHHSQFNWFGRVCQMLEFICQISICRYFYAWWRYYRLSRMKIGTCFSRRRGRFYRWVQNATWVVINITRAWYGINDNIIKRWIGLN